METNPAPSASGRELAEALLSWYAANRRALPWREARSPYRTWVSEIMLQQTQVSVVIPYFERFTERLPGVAALAAASDEQLDKLWEGLGYYSRVRNMKRAAAAMMRLHGGELPREREALLALPGIGAYTAGAILSIAYGIPAPAVDGNVLRVLARLRLDTRDIASVKVGRDCEEYLRGLIPPRRAGDFTEALMELGATVCVKGAARCGACPWRAACAANRAGVVAELPKRAAKKARRVERRTVFVVRAGEHVLLVRRPERGLLAGLWEPLAAEGALDAGEAAEFLKGIGAEAPTLRELPPARHVFSHVVWEMRGYLVDTARFREPEGGAWVRRSELEPTVALPSAFGAYRRYMRSEEEK